MRPASGVRRSSLSIVGAIAIIATASCSSSTEPRAPTLGTSFELTAFDGHPLPVATTVRLQQTITPTNLISGTFELTDLSAVWNLSLHDDVTSIESNMVISGNFRHRVVGRDSVEILAGATALFGGHFSDTALVLMPTAGANASAPIMDFMLHSWTFRVSPVHTP